MKRDLHLDGLKFIMIFLVVLGHLSYHGYGLKINTMIYSFHMPVFVFLSGYFTSLSATREKQNKWINRTLLIFVFAQLAHIILEVLLMSIHCYTHHESFDWSIFGWDMITSPRLALWYLVCLLYWRISIWSLFKNCRAVQLFAISCVLSIASGFIPIDHDFSFQRAFSFFPFFALGIYFKEHRLMNKIKEINILYPIIFLVIGLLASRYLPIFMPKMHYADTRDLVLRAIQSSVGIVLCLSILRIAYSKWITKFADLGAYTLWIYIGHTYLIVIGQKVFPYLDISLNVLSALLLAMVYCFIFIALSKLYKTHKSINHQLEP